MVASGYGEVRFYVVGRTKTNLCINALIENNIPYTLNTFGYGNNTETDITVNISDLEKLEGKRFIKTIKKDDAKAHMINENIKQIVLGNMDYAGNLIST